MRKYPKIVVLFLIAISAYLFAQTCSGPGSCPYGYFCQTAPGDCGGEGTCVKRPDYCIALWAPVCGCDNVTYSNDCYAAMAGVSVAYSGQCSFPNYCTDNDECSQSKYCQKPEGDCDGVGICADRPTVCPDVWDPVCGCDGSTYANACYAAMFGVSIAYDGECLPPPCSDNGDCDSSSYCQKAPGECDGLGTCAPRPTICPTLWDPVCGCDGLTYSNDCFAAEAGVNVAYAGQCAVCVNKPLSDLNDDCKTNLKDLAIMAWEWLACGYNNAAACE